MSEIVTKIRCSACGTSPVNHRLLYISNFLDATLGDISNRFFEAPSTGGADKLTMTLEKILFRVFSFIGIISFSNDIEKALTGRSKLVWEEARLRHIEMRQVAVFGKPIEYYRAIIKGNVHYFFSLPIPPELEQSGYKWLDDKFVLFKRLSKRGVNVPKTIELFTWGKALKHFPNFNKPVIIKPKSGSRSRHTTTQIKTLEELRHGYNLAKEITPTLVMQEHLFGSVYRATVIQNKLVGFFQGNPAKIAGDGVTTIKELIAQQNKNRNDRLSEILINNDLLSFIERQAYNLESILPQGQDLYLSGKIGRMYGGHTKEMLPEVHLKLHEIMRRAGEAVSAPVVGFDLIMEDPTQDPDAQRWGIIECNSLPFIDLHYFPLEGTPINLAKNVWDLWNK